MKTINQLTPVVIARIAAGEVVERPASIIKELLENALDAKAQHISISLTKGGIEKIIIKDDGCGMSREDLALCFLPHTTSKLCTEDDLLSIASFGFRGEALSSIVAVSDVIIKSREQSEEHGYQVEINQGNPEDSEPVGMSVGTEIIITNLFATIPARKKFLGTPAAEVRAIVDIVSNTALAYPAIGFSITNDTKRIFDVSAGQTIEQRMNSLLGDDIVSALLPISHQTQHGTISGFIGTPQSARASTTHQYLFINNRPLSAKLISSHVTDSYGSLIEPRTQGMFVIHLSLPFETVDVNIHPKKLEVGLAYQKEIENLVREAVKKSLQDHKLTYTFADSDSQLRDKGMDRYTAELLKSIVSPWDLKSDKPGSVIQINNLYLVASTKKGLLLVDQHAAHERILFEQFKSALENSSESQEAYVLNTPVLISLSSKDATVLQTELSTLTTLGFDIEQFGHNTFKLTSVPTLFKTKDYKSLLISVLDDLTNGRGDHVERASYKTLSYLACRAAIKAGEALSQDECTRLIEKLLETNTPYTCPHGRPTHIELSLKDLDILFKRR